MKKIIGSSLSILALAVLGTGCLKDKGFENQDYGSQIQDSRAVSFPQARSASSISYGILSSITALDVTGPIIGLEVPAAQSNDTHITLQINDALVTADPTLNVLPSTEYNLDLNRTIEAGTLYDTIMLNLPHSANLDPNLTYAIGLSITSSDNDFAIASNMRDILLKFTIKNKYDGVYEVTGAYVDVPNPPFTDLYPLEYRLVTTGPASVDVQLYLNTSGGAGWFPGYLFFTGTQNSYYGSYGLTMTFDPANGDIISDLHNYYGDPSKGLTPVGDPSAGSGAPDYASANTRRAVLDATGVNAWDENGGNPIITIKHQMLQPSVVPVGPRATFDEVWTRTGDRP